MPKYAIWNKQDAIYTPVGEVFTAEQWLDRYGWASHPLAKPVVAGGLVNGAFMGELSQMKEMYAKMGADFSACTTDEEILAVIEDYEDNPVVDDTPSAEERTAAALETIANGATSENTAAMNALLTGEE
ncbi:MAG: hypothetical protein ACOX81_10175 [Candidatus Heteroscillospira sp.]|jgi:hypothetical protein